MNLTEETKIIPKRWRAEKGSEFAYITINSFGNVRITKGWDYRHPAEDRLYESGNYFRICEVHKFADILTALFKNRI